MYKYNEEMLETVKLLNILKNKNIEIIASEIQEKFNFNLSILDIKNCIIQYETIQKNKLIERMAEKLDTEKFIFRLEKNIKDNKYYISTPNVNKNRKDKWSKHNLCNTNTKNSSLEAELIDLFDTFPNKKIRGRLITEFIGYANLQLTNTNKKIINFMGIYKVVSYSLGK